MRRIAVVAALLSSPASCFAQPVRTGGVAVETGPSGLGNAAAGANQGASQTPGGVSLDLGATIVVPGGVNQGPLTTDGVPVRAAAQPVVQDAAAGQATVAADPQDRSDPSAQTRDVRVETVDLSVDPVAPEASLGAGAEPLQGGAREIQAEQKAAKAEGRQASVGVLQGIVNSIFDRRRRDVAPADDVRTAPQGAEEGGVRADGSAGDSRMAEVTASVAGRYTAVDAKAPGWHEGAIRAAAAGAKESARAEALDKAEQAVPAALSVLPGLVRARDERAAGYLEVLSGWDALLSKKDLFPDRGGRPYIEGLRTMAAGGEGILPKANRALGPLGAGDAASFPDRLYHKRTKDGWTVSEKPFLRDVIAAVPAQLARMFALPDLTAGPFVSPSSLEAPGIEADAEGSVSRAFRLEPASALGDFFLRARGSFGALLAWIEARLQDTGVLLFLQGRGWLAPNGLAAVDRRPARLAPLRSLPPSRTIALSVP